MAGITPTPFEAHPHPWVASARRRHEQSFLVGTRPQTHRGERDTQSSRPSCRFGDHWLKACDQRGTRAPAIRHIGRWQGRCPLAVSSVPSDGTARIRSRSPRPQRLRARTTHASGKEDHHDGRWHARCLLTGASQQRLEARSNEAIRKLAHNKQAPRIRRGAWQLVAVQRDRNYREMMGYWRGSWSGRRDLNSRPPEPHSGAVQL